MQTVRLEEREPFVTADGSTIRELAGVPSGNAVNQSLAQATVPPGGETVEHFHRQAEEIYHFTAGAGRMRLGAEEADVRAGDTVVIAPGVPHKLWNTERGRPRAPVLLRAAVLARRHRPARGLMRALAVLAAAAVLAGCGSERSAVTAGGRRGRRQPDDLRVGARARRAASDATWSTPRSSRSPRRAATSATSGSTSWRSTRARSARPTRRASRRAAAEQVIRDTQVIAVVGAVRSDTALTSLPLFNAAGILLVSPGAGYPGFTEPVAAGEPDRWYPSGRRRPSRA